MIITRFAPSPSGYLHLGNIRIALFSWIFSKFKNGKFLLRIEDTDEKRSKKFYIKNIIEDLKWLNIKWDNEIIYQSKRKKFYINIINNLLESKLAYPCFCNKKRITNIKKECFLKNKNYIYDKYCRNKNFNKNDLINKKYVVRFKNPKNSYVKFNDIIFGKLKFDNNFLDDFIICRSNGIPTYNFCVIIDDIYMKVNYIIRGSDHINNTPKQINIIKSINGIIPKYIHIPIILNKNNQKLTKKNNEYSIKKFIKEGYLPNSIISYLINIGHKNSYSNLNKNYLLNNFCFKNIKKNNIIIDKKSISNINKKYLSTIISKYKLFKFIKKYIKNIKIKPIKNKKIKRISFYLNNRHNTFKEIINYNINILYKIKYKYIKKTKKYIYIKNLIIKFIFELENLENWNIKNIIYTINNYIYKLKKNKKNKFYLITRLLLIFKKKSIKLSILLFIISKKESLKRLNIII